VVQAVAVRSERSLERWGENVDLIWANDGRGLIILVGYTDISRQAFAVYEGEA
jgi:hypothetical protein